MARPPLPQNRPFAGAVFLSALLLSACSTGEPLVLSDYSRLTEKPSRFSLCHGYGCAHKTRLRLTDAEWQQARAPLAARAADAAQEREHIVLAVAGLERITGAKAGTNADEAGAALLGYDPHQLDCIDETVNTSLYLRFFANAGLLAHHTVEAPVTRGNFTDGAWPHNTAVIRDTRSGQSYAVDSWFGKNGDAPHIIPVEQWVAGWKP